MTQSRQDIAHLLARYPDLSEAEKRALASAIEAYPDLASAFHTMEQMERLLEQAARLEHPDSEEALVAYVLSEAMLPAPLPPELETLRARVEQRLKTDPELEKRYRQLRARLTEAEAHLPPPDEHLERLRARLPDSRSRVVRLHPRAWALAAMLLVVITYGLLYLASYARMPLPQRLAWRLPVPEIRAESLTFRGTPEALSEGTQAFLEGLRLLRTSRTSVLGLFPRYDARRLEEAARRFRRAREAAGESDPVLYEEATFYLAVTYLAQGRVEEARELLQEIEQRGGSHAAEARRLLEELQA